MKFRALADQTDGSGLGRGEVARSALCSVLGVGFAMQKCGRVLTAGQDSFIVSSCCVFFSCVPPQS